MEEEITIDFSYIDNYLEMILSKIITHGTITMFNGYENKVIFLEKDEKYDFIYYYLTEENEKIEIYYEEIIQDFMEMFKTSIGKMTIIYRVYVGKYNPNTEGEFRELWGDILFIDADTLKLTKMNIKAEQLGTILVNLKLSEDEVKVFGKPEEYVFKDEQENIILGLDLI
jgi:hypothetical protein